MLWHTIRYLLTFLIPTFYSRIQGRNLRQIMVDGPVIIAMNHPNAFTDPILITYLTYPVRVNYLARGDAFKPGLVSWLLEKIGIVPIFRIQDGGKEGLKKNDEAYRRVNHLLSKNAKLIVFAEGICVQERRLRPLKKGVARMVFGAFEAVKNENLVVVPVGVNYSQPDEFRSTAFYNVGEPIFLRELIEEHQKHPARGNNAFLQHLEQKMLELVIHIEDKKNDELVKYIEEMCTILRIKELGLNERKLEDHFFVLKEFTQKVNNAARQNQAMLDELTIELRNYFGKLKKHGLGDWMLDPNRNTHVNLSNLFARCVFLLLGLPLYVAGLVGNLLPMFVTHKLSKKIIKKREFYSSLALGIGMVLFIVNYLLLFFVFYHFSEGVIPPLCACVVSALCGWFSLYYQPFAVKSFQMARLLSNRALEQNLLEERKKKLSLINKF